MNNHQRRTAPRYILLSFLLIVVLGAIDIGVDLQHTQHTQQQMQRLLTTHTHKIRLVQAMRTYMRERLISLNTMLLVDDTFAVEASYEQFLEWGNRFIDKRRELSQLVESEEERARLDEFRLSTMEGSLTIEHAVAMARGGEDARSREALFQQVLPLQEKMIGNADALLQFYFEQISGHIRETQRQTTQWRLQMVILGVAMLLAIFVIVLYVVRRMRRDRVALQQAKEGLESAVEVRTRELANTAKQLKAAQHVARLGHWEWDIPSGALYWSDEIYRIFGVEPGAFEPSYDDFLQAVHPEDRNRVVSTVEAAVRGEGPYSVEHRVVHPDGTERVVHERGMVSFSEDGAALRMLGTVQDVTERKETEKQLQLAASVFHSTGDGIMITDHERHIVDVNSAFCELFGYDKAEVLGQNPRMLRSGRHDEAFFQQFWGQLERGGQWQGEIWDRHKRGQLIPLWLTVNAVHDENGTLTNYVALFRDITKSKENEQHLWQIAHHDPLTGLPNRSLMYARMELAMQQADREKAAMALMLIDLDGFKQVNDTLGHGAGDEVLGHVATILSERVRESDTVVRYAGDEFVVILKGLYQREAIKRIADAIIAGIAEPMIVAGERVQVGASIGVAVYPTNAYDTDSLIARADEAMYRAKKAGKGRCRFYDERLG